MTNQFHTCEGCHETVEKLVEGLCRPCEEERREDEVERVEGEGWDDDCC